MNDDLSCSRPSVSGRKEPSEKLQSVGGTKACLTASCEVCSWPLGRVSDLITNCNGEQEPKDLSAGCDIKDLISIPTSEGVFWFGGLWFGGFSLVFCFFFF